MAATNFNLLFTMFTASLLMGCAQSSVPQTKAVNVAASQTIYSAAATCTGQSLDARFNRPVLQGNFDNALFDAAVLHYTNERRCANGIAPLAGDPLLQNAAGIHSADMATHRFFSHNSVVPGRETLDDRLKASGVKLRSAAENIATRPRLQIAGGQPFYVVDSANCQFTSNGKEVQPHTYNSIAESFVTQWENSPGHRENLFNPEFTKLGSGGSIQSNEQVCGDIVATQNFAS